MHRTIIADTSCFIVLGEIEEIQLLQKVYGQIITTSEIASEYGDSLPDWVEILDVVDKQKQYILELQIDKGESSAIALAMEMKNTTLIIDDYKARRIAEQLGIHYTGTIGVIIKAKLNGTIPSIKPLLQKIRTTNFRLSAILETEALKAADEYTI